ncbi:mucin-4-like, partial [Carlito syrichta]|uniref:Mucin-4-like n=1 Tax=Carlito syrichta TaxID=1868482 RepID=A0A3Q0DKV4_CARSF
EVLTTSTSPIIHENFMTAVVIPPVHSGNVSLGNTTQVPISTVGISGTPSPEHPSTVQRGTSTTKPMTMSVSVSSTDTPNSAASSTLTVAGHNHRTADNTKQPRHHSGIFGSHTTFYNKHHSSGHLCSVNSRRFRRTMDITFCQHLNGHNTSQHPNPPDSRDGDLWRNIHHKTYLFSVRHHHREHIFSFLIHGKWQNNFRTCFPRNIHHRGPYYREIDRTVNTNFFQHISSGPFQKRALYKQPWPLVSLTCLPLCLLPHLCPGMTTASLRTESLKSSATTLPSTAFQTLRTSTPSTPTVMRSPTPLVPVQPEKGVSLFPYGSSANDVEFVRRTVDFNSPLFKPQIGFPFGSYLRDSLYFTDNGQIIFPESDYQIFSYPNPLFRGFTRWDTVALVAPFWDDADFSSGRGTIFYQEYETLNNEHDRLVLQVESWIQKFTNTWHYKARWTLKVTWVNVPAYPAQWTFGTNTYQAILSTDGSRSYALFLYQSGGMRWDVTQRPGNPVLMGFSSGDGYFGNSPLMFQPRWEKYRPDQFLDSNLGIQGLQVFRLHREERPNYRLKCLQWLNNQPQWPSWSWSRSQISCPCSWQQGLWDLRFQPVSKGWWSLGHWQLCSFSSWQGGVCCSYGPWGEFREGWRVQSPWQWAQELEPQEWCCRWNDKPYLCTLYQQKWPPISCAGYRPPQLGWMFGDPHITTLDGVNYTFNGLGDFLLVHAWNRNSSFLLQGRTAQTSSAQATNFIAFAAQYQSSSLGPITVQWLLEPNDMIHVLLDNQTVTFETNPEDEEGQEIFNATGVLLICNGSTVSASFDGSVTISVIALSNILHASTYLSEDYQNNTEGLLGVWNNNPDDDFRMPNGSTIPQGTSEEMLFRYGMTWELNGTGLLGERIDRLPSNFTPIFYSQLLGNSSLNDKLISNCNGDRQCIYDTLVTRNASIGLHTMMISRTYQQMNSTLNQFPPSISGRRVIEAYKGQTTQIQYTSTTEDVTFILGNNHTDVKLF